MRTFISNKIWLEAILFVAALSCSCASVSDKVVVDDVGWLKDGQMKSWKLGPGTYKLEMTATGDGATIEFAGCNCPAAPKETTSFSSMCEFTQTGQVLLKNPSVLGLGEPVSCTVKVTRLAR